MKKFILTLLGTLILGAISAFATDVTISQSTFTAISGNVGDDANISYKAEKGNAGTAPAINDGEIRVYQNGGLFTISAAEGCTMTEVILGSSMKTTVDYKIDDNNPTTGQSIAANGKLTVSNISASSITFTCKGTDKYSRLYVNYISVTYSTGGTAEPTITLSFGENNEGSVNVGETLSLPEVGATVSEGTLPELSYSYTSDNTEVATVENGVVTGVAAGTATITASCVVEGYNVKDAEYTVTVVDPNALFVELTPQTFNYVTNSYGTASFTDPVTNVSYSAVYYGSNTFMQFNTGNNNGKGSGINVTVPSDDYLISSIAIEFDTPSAGLNVYAKDDAFSALTKTGTPSTSGATKINNSAIKADQTIAINKKAFALLPAGSGAIKVKKVTVNYKKIDSSKTTPKLSFAETEVVEEFVEGKTLAVQVPTSDTEGLSYTYTSSDPAVATVYGETITLVGTGSTTITVTSAETETLNSATASYTLVSEMVYHSIADLLKYAKDGETVDIAFPMTVGHVGPQGKNFYVTDGEGYMLIYNQNYITMPAYENLDVIPAGWTATCTIYNGLPELVPTTAPAAASEKGTYTFETIDAASWTAQPLNKIVIVDNVEFTAATPSDKSKFTGTSGETEITFYNNFALPAEEAGTYKVTAIVSHYTKDMTTIATEANQLAPISFSIQPTEATVTPAPDANGEIKVKAGDKITFTVPNAAKLEVEIITDEPSAESAPILKATSNQPVEGDTYTYTVPAEVVPTMITVTPINAEGEKLTKLATTVMLVNADTTGVIDVTVAGEGEIEYFNLQGVRVANPESGLYIRRQGNQVSKVYLR